MTTVAKPDSMVSDDLMLIDASLAAGLITPGLADDMRHWARARCRPLRLVHCSDLSRAELLHHRITRAKLRKLARKADR